MRKIKVLQVNKLYFPVTGGIERTVQNIAEGLSKEFDMRVLVCQKKGIGAEEVVHGVPVYRARSYGTLFSMPISFDFIFKLRKECKNQDIIHFHVPFPLGDLGCLLSGYKGNVVVYWHSDVVKQKKFMFLYRPVMNLFLKRADVILVGAQGILDGSHYLKPYREKCRVIPFPVSEEIRKDGEAYFYSQKEEKSDSSEVKFLFVGRLVYYKGCEVLLKALQDVRGAVLTIVGTGELEHQLKQLSQDLGVGNRVRFMGQVSDEEMKQCFRETDVFVLPSVMRSEAFGLVQLEAMSYGKPVINTNLPSGVPNVSLHEVTGLTVEPEDVKGLSEAMNWMIHHPRERRQYGIAARKRLEETYTLEKILPQIKNLYMELLDNEESVMNPSKIVLDITGYLKPVLVKIFPARLLRQWKGRMIRNSYKKLEHVQIEPFDREKHADGINLIGNIQAATGLGQSCRLIASVLEHGTLPFSVYQYHQLGIMQNQATRFDEKMSSELPYNINIIHINPHELGLAFQQLGKSVWDTRYNIGFWAWELEELPDEWLPCFRCLNEVWAPSEFTAKSIRAKTKLPVVSVPYHVDVSIEKEYTREDFGLPQNQFLFLMMYDKTSTSERKNPQAVLEAFKRAFRPEEAAGLVVKINNCTEEEIRDLKAELKDYPHTCFITEVMDRNRVNNLIRCVDALVSLHRAEGFGLILAEAMLLGTPVIATNWSSNTEFMTKECSCLVDYNFIEIQEDMGLFKKGNRWADADVDQAAMYMRKLYEEPEYCRELAARAEAFAKEHLSEGRAQSIIQGRIQAIYKNCEDR